MQRRKFLKRAGIIGGGGVLLHTVYAQQMGATSTSDPRAEIKNLISGGQTESLMTKAGQLHGHYCLGLAMGILAATYAMQKMSAEKGLKAIIEKHNCLADGIQFVTGCSIGNGSLIYRDTGKLVFSLVNENGKGLRLCANDGDTINKAFPNTSSLEKAFGTLKIPVEQLFAITEIQIVIPEYERAEEILCASCGEGVKKSHLIEKEGKYYCSDCAKNDCFVLDAYGIHQKTSGQY